MKTTLATLTLAAMSPAAIFACPVCGLASTSNNQSAYVSMSVMLSAVPLGMIGGLGYWLYRRVTAAK